MHSELKEGNRSATWICGHRPGNRPWQLSSNLSTVDSGGSGRIIAVAAPGRMVEVNNGIAVPRDHRIVEGQRTDSLPALKLASLAQRGAAGQTIVSDFNVKGQFSLGFRISLVEYLGHYFIAKIEQLTLNARLFSTDKKPHKFGGSRRLTLRLAKLRNLIELPDCGLFVRNPQYHASHQQDG